MKENLKSYPEITLHGHPDAQYYLRLGRALRAAYISAWLKQAGAFVLNATKSVGRALSHRDKPAVRV